MGRMKDPFEHPPTYPPGFEPPTDVNVPWYAWVFWPFAILALIGIAVLVFKLTIGLVI